MDFIEKLPMANGFDMILVTIFIPTINTIMSPMLAKLFILHVFSRHGIPSHITSNRGMEFVSTFFHSLSKSPRYEASLHFWVPP